MSTASEKPQENEYIYICNYMYILDFLGMYVYMYVHIHINMCTVFKCYIYIDIFRSLLELQRVEFPVEINKKHPESHSFLRPP